MTLAAEPPPSAAEILQQLRAFREGGSVLYVAAHPDDENTQFIAYLAKERGVRVGYLSLTRGEGGQNLIGPELGDPLGVIRTQELLAARRIDGGQQFFTRARDFGYSKDSEQTLAKWDRQGVLSDVVRVVRQFRPDVIVTRFPPEPGGTHGHHTASTILALEAFQLAGDPKAFPEQLTGLNAPAVWQPKRIFWNSFRGTENRPTLHLDIGGYLPLLGQTVGQIAALSRSSHRSQGFGSIGGFGSRLDEFQALDSRPVGGDLFADIDPVIPGWVGWPEARRRTDEIIARFNPQEPAASVPALLALRARCFGIVEDHKAAEFAGEKGRQLDRVLQACLGLYVQTTVPQAEVVPGETLKLTHAAMLGTKFPVRWRAVDYPDGSHEDAEVDLQVNRPVTQTSSRTLPTNTPVGHPYWLRQEGSAGMYRVDDPALIGRADNPPAFPVSFRFEVGGQTLVLPADPIQLTADPARGEVRRKLEVIPPVSLALAHGVELFAPSSDKPVVVEVRAYRDHTVGTLQLDAPTGWAVSRPQPFELATTGDSVRLTFTVTAPPQPGTANIAVRATVDGKTYDTGRQEIRYEHIPFQLLQPRVSLDAVCLDLAIRGKQIAYLPGAGDTTVESLEQMGYAVTTLSGADLTTERLRQFDAVVVGVRAFNVRTDLAPGLPALFAYVENGGTVVEQYNTPRDLQNTRLAPYNLTLSPNLPPNRVTDENAPVSILAPDHPAFNVPNRIIDADFAGWVQERGLNFPSEWDHGHFTALLACSDPGEVPLQSGLLVARHGKGYFVYTGLSFFRQLPAGVPGAYRLFANLVSLGK